MDVHDTIGFDLVGMVVDDLVVCGAEPLFMTDYIACGRVVPERIAAIVKGIAEACVEAGCALVGGETAEHPGLLEPDEYDVAGATTGVVEADDLLGPAGSGPATWCSRWRRAGCTPTATPWSATCCSTQAGWALDRDVPELGRTLGEELLEPTRIYAKACLALAARDRHARDGARHRRRAGRQPGPGDARGAHGHPRPRHLDAGADLRPRTPGGRRAAGRPRGDAQLRRRHGRAARRPTTSTAAIAAARRASGSTPGWPARSTAATGADGDRRAGRPAPRLVTPRPARVRRFVRAFSGRGVREQPAIR